MKTKLSGKVLNEGVVTLNGEVSGQEIEIRKSNAQLNEDQLKRASAIVYPGGDNDANHVIPQGALCLARRGRGGISKTPGTHGRVIVFNSFNGMAIPKDSSPEEIMDGFFCPGASKSTFDQRSPNQVQIGIALVYRGKTTIPFESADGQPVFPGDLLVICAPEISVLRKGSNRSQIPVTQLTPKLKSFDYKDVFFYHKNVVQWIVKQHFPLFVPPATKGSNASSPPPPVHSLYEIMRDKHGTTHPTRRVVSGINTKKSMALQSAADKEKGYVLSLVFKVVETLVATGVLVVNTPDVYYKLTHVTTPANLAGWKHGDDTQTSPNYKSLQTTDDPVVKRNLATRLIYDDDTNNVDRHLAHLARLMGFGDTLPDDPINATTLKEESIVQNHCLHSFAALVCPESKKTDAFSCFRGRTETTLKTLKIPNVKTTMKYFAENREAANMHYRNKMGHRIIGTSMSYGDPHIPDPQIDVLLTGGKFH